jgi:hypothetical protein
VVNTIAVVAPHRPNSISTSSSNIMSNSHNIPNTTAAATIMIMTIMMKKTTTMVTHIILTHIHIIITPIKLVGIVKQPPLVR